MHDARDLVLTIPVNPVNGPALKGREDASRNSLDHPQIAHLEFAGRGQRAPLLTGQRESLHDVCVVEAAVCAIPKGRKDSLPIELDHATGRKAEPTADISRR